MPRVKREISANKPAVKDVNSFAWWQINRIKPRPYNPAVRLKDAGFLKLEREIAELGLMYPLLVKNNGDLIDGHRRLQAMKNIGFTEVPVIVVSNKESADEIYGRINITAARLTGNQVLQVFLKKPEAVSRNMRSRLQNAEAKYGRTILKKVSDHGSSLDLLRAAQQICNYVCREEDNKLARTTAEWLMRHKQTRLVRAYLHTLQSPINLLRLIKANKPIRITMK